MQIPDSLSSRLADPPATPKVAVVVCTYRRPKSLEACLASLNRLDYPRFEVLVVDNHPEPAAQAVAARAGAGYVPAPVRGLSHARNVGVRGTRSDIVAFFDDDMLADPAWLSALVDELRDPAVAAVTGPVLPMSLAGASQAALEAALLAQPWGTKGFTVDRGADDWFERAHFGGVGDGNMAFRRSLFDAGLAFEERIGRGRLINGGEEHYAFFSVIAGGHRIAYSPRARVFHPEPARAREASRKAIEDCGAYVSFLLARHPRYAHRVVRFLAQAALAKARPWRPAEACPPQARLGRKEKAAAFWRGVRSYRQARREAAQPHPAAALGAGSEGD